MEMEKWIRTTLAATKKYTVWDFGLFKIAIFAFGLLVGAYFRSLFLDFAAIIWLIFLLASAWIIYVTLVKYKS